MTIDVITFDLDNTLWDVDSVIREAERTMREWLHERVPEYASEISAETAMSIRRELVATNPGIAHDLSKLRVAVMFEAIQRCGYASPQAREYAEGAFEVFMHGRHAVVYFDGALQMLQKLSERYRLGALTNGNADFERLGLDRFFSFGFSAADVGASKPDPAMFRAALAHTGAQAHRAVHVGDNPIDDVQGAKALGMHTVWVNHGTTKPPTDPRSSDTPVKEVSATVEVNHLADIPDAIVDIAS